MHTILLTGFGSFPGVPKNPTADVVARLDGAKIAHSGREGVVRGVLLDVIWDSGGTADGRTVLGAAEALRAAVATSRPDALVSMGVASSERLRFRIERRPTNVRAEVADALGRKPGPRGDELREIVTSLPWPWVIEELARRGIEMEPSDEAGKYLCEAIAYEGALLVAERAPKLALSGFIHVPNVYAVDDELAAGRITQEDRAKLPTLQTILEAMGVVLEIALAHLPEVSGPAPLRGGPV